MPLRTVRVDASCLFVLSAEGLAVGIGRKAIRDLLEFLPRELSLRRSGSVQTVVLQAVWKGNSRYPGARILVDRLVTSGFSFVYESRIMGESMPIEKGRG